MRIFRLLFIVTAVSILSFGLFLPAPAQAASKGELLQESPYQTPVPRGITVTKITGDLPDGYLAPSLASQAGTICDVKHYAELTWLITGWLIGEEIYSAYQDPDAACLGAYPFTVNEAHIFLQIIPDASITLPMNIPMSLELQSIDSTTEAGCARPGDTFFKGSPGLVPIPTPGIYDISIPLDFPVEVTGPYFVGIRFDSVVTTSMGISLITDATEAACVTFNLWDSAVGYIDLGDDTLVHQFAYPETDRCFSAEPNDSLCFDFDGRFAIYTQGETGGKLFPDPVVDFLSPHDGDIVYESIDIWVSETTSSQLIDSAVFYWGAPGSWTRLGVDADLSDEPFGLPASGAGPGLSFVWDFSSLAEQNTWIRVIVYDSLGRSAGDSIQITLEPTPPLPKLVTGDYYDAFCDPLLLTYTFTDEDALTSSAFYKPAGLEYRKEIATFDQFTLGQGVFGDFYGGPTVGAIGLEHWVDQGFPLSMRDGGSKISISAAATRLAGFMKVEVDTGLTDENFVSGFRIYLAQNGFNELKLDYTREPSYSQMRNWGEEVEAFVMFKLNDGAGHWYALEGFSGLPTQENAYRVIVSDPRTGTKRIIFWRDITGGSEIFQNGSWRRVTLLTALSPTKDWNGGGGRTLFNQAAPFPSGSVEVTLDGTTNGFTDGNLYFITRDIFDLTGNFGEHTVMFQYICSAYTPGDYDANGFTNIADLVYLIVFQTSGGPAPIGGAGRADANCDGFVDTADLVHFSNWMFLGGLPPCQ